ncbi:MAG: hypothetical protein LAQ69_01040 [Acidobacteriia bacterium]|nr:hypothetical protein [Terriglobia bacterium]
MRYWAYFAAKLVAGGALLYGLLVALNSAWPAEVPHFFTYVPPRFGYDLPFTLAVLVWFLLCTGTFYLIIWDQRYRCRVCLRRLRMPVETGSWSRMLQFGRPRIEYICTYGHGTLKEDELQISGLENPEWTPHSDDLWEELCASSKEPGDQP